MPLWPLINKHSLLFQQINLTFLAPACVIMLLINKLLDFILNIIYGKALTIYQRMQDSLNMAYIVVNTCIVLSLAVLCIFVIIPFIFQLHECCIICYNFVEFYCTIFLKSSLYINSLIALIVVLLYLSIDLTTSIHILPILFTLMMLLLSLIESTISLIIILANISDDYIIEFIVDYAHLNILSNVPSLNFYDKHIDAFNDTNINFWLRKYSFSYIDISIIIHVFFIINYIIIFVKVSMVAYRYYMARPIQHLWIRYYVIILCIHLFYIVSIYILCIIAGIGFFLLYH